MRGKADVASLPEWARRLEGLEIPTHIAVVMDGNGRWAQQRGLPRIMGHMEGRKATRRMVEAAHAIGVGVLSVYAFSAENWRRSEEEVAGLMMLIEEAMREEMEALAEANVRVRASGRLEVLPESLQAVLAAGQECTRDCTGMILNLLVNYGGRAEIVDAARRLAQEAAGGTLDPASIDEDLFAQRLYAPELPDPDLVLRPGGEQRISNFLLWEIAYSEIVVMPVLWPDFQPEHLVQAIVEYNARQRRFGGVPEITDREV